uniref:Uncharacterized protein n=1 Tax=Panagrolaimus sp. JU765 TaxID=591449 RepID=A0AC34QB73_9BILA
MATTSDGRTNFRVPGAYLDLAAIGNEAAGITGPIPSSIEEHDDNQNHQESHTDETHVGPRFFNRIRNFFRRFTSSEYNPHTILNNDFSSVNEDDIEGVTVLPRTRDQMTSSTTSSRSLIMEPLPQRSNSPTPTQQESSDSEVEVLNELPVVSESLAREDGTRTPPPPDPQSY